MRRIPLSPRLQKQGSDHGFIEAGSVKIVGRGQAQWFRSTSASSIGIEIALSIVVGTLAGKWVQDRYPQWSPWALLLGLAFGCVAAVGAVRRALRSYNKELDMVANEEELKSESSRSWAQESSKTIFSELGSKNENRSDLSTRSESRGLVTTERNPLNSERVETKNPETSVERD